MLLFEIQVGKIEAFLIDSQPEEYGILDTLFTFWLISASTLVSFTTVFWMSHNAPTEKKLFFEAALRDIQKRLRKRLPQRCCKKERFCLLALRHQFHDRQ